jgi:hypothetical protein
MSNMLFTLRIDCRGDDEVGITNGKQAVKSFCDVSRYTAD